MLEDFEYMGFWWLPENPDKKISGILKFKANKEMVLELFGAFHKSLKEFSDTYLYPEIILGESVLGEKITLYKSNETRKTVSERLYQISVFNCLYVFNGKHFTNANELRFSSMTANFTNLEDWLFPLPYELEGFGCKYNNPERHEIKMKKLDATISILYTPSVSIGSKCVKLSFESFFLIKTRSDKDLLWYENVILNLENFLTFIFEFPVYPKIIKAKSLTGEDISIH
jgi:hypothetical protein